MLYYELSSSLIDKLPYLLLSYGQVMMVLELLELKKFFFNTFIYLFLPVLGLGCCEDCSLVVVSEGRGFSLWWLLVAEHGL